MRWTFAPVAVLAATSGSTHAVQYLTVEQAQKLLFVSAAEFTPSELLLTDAQRQAIVQASGVLVRLREARVRCWSARDAQGKASAASSSAEKPAAMPVKGTWWVTCKPSQVPSQGRRNDCACVPT